jgi:hypothetical protein
MLPPWVCAFCGVPQAGDLALDTGGGLFAPVGRDDLPVQDHGREPLVVGPLQRPGPLRRLPGQHGDDLIEAAAGGSPADAVVAGQRAGGGAAAEPPPHPAQPAQSRPAPGSRAGYRAAGVAQLNIMYIIG